MIKKIISVFAIVLLLYPPQGKGIENGFSDSTPNQMKFAYSVYRLKTIIMD
jgi:hypothetical protein